MPLDSRRWAEVADTHIPSIARSLMRIAAALERMSPDKSKQFPVEMSGTLKDPDQR